MKCSECENLIDDYLDNELDLETRETVNAHFTECPSCNDKILALQQALSAFKTGLATLQVSDNFSCKVMEEIDLQETTSFWVYTLAGVLGSMVLSLAAFTLLLYPVLQIAVKYTVQLLTLWVGIASLLPFNSILLILFSLLLVFIAMAMRGIIHTEEGQV